MMSQRLLFPLACILLLWTTLSSAVEPDRPPKLAADRVKLVRQMYAKLPGDILGFAEPAKRIVVAQNDGQTIMLLLQDANDKKLAINLLKWGESADSLLLATGRLPPRGPEEAAVYGLLLRLSAKPPDKTMELQLQLMDAMLAVLDQRFAGATPISPTRAEK